MLAEKKARKPWTLNPRGKFWSEDSNKFGQKLLERMGWERGKGLGKNEDGNVEHIHVTYKNDNRGIGFKDNDDKWIGHTVDFNSLLADLQSTVGGSESQTQPKIQNLEGRSKMLRGRVHYGRFVQGKDLSKRSDKDMLCVFGTRRLSQAEEKPSLQEPRPLNSDESTSKNETFTSLLPTYTSSLSIQEYFSRKSAYTDIVYQEEQNICKAISDFSKENSAADNSSGSNPIKKPKQNKRKQDDVEEMANEAFDVSVVGSAKQDNEDEPVDGANLYTSIANEEQIIENKTNQCEPYEKKKPRKKLKRNTDENSVHDMKVLDESENQKKSSTKAKEEEEKKETCKDFEQSNARIDAVVVCEKKAKSKKKQKNKSTQETATYEDHDVNRRSSSLKSKETLCNSKLSNTDSECPPDCDLHLLKESEKCGNSYDAMDIHENKPVGSNVPSKNYTKKKDKSKARNMDEAQERPFLYEHVDGDLMDASKNVSPQSKMIATDESINSSDLQQELYRNLAEENIAKNGLGSLKKSFNFQSDVISNLPWAKAILENERLATTNLLSIKGYGQYLY